ncbi:MAG: winged helix DNA-binding protein [Clostridia bacterium]|nr:winged helix DNA-binding protein [Clostridia bacterium]
MDSAQLAYRLRVLFEQKITAHYFDSFKGTFGRVQVEVLSLLYDRRTVRAGELVELLNISKQHASKILLRLEEQGLVTWQEDPADRRRTLFQLSPQGQQLMSDHLAHSNRIFDEGLLRLSESERRTLHEAMLTMTELLERL